jgi:hypothetical protein
MDSAKRFICHKLIVTKRAGSKDLTQISIIELAVKMMAFIKKVFFMTVGTIICAAGTTCMYTSSMYGFGLTLIITGVVFMVVKNWIIGTPWAEKNSDCQANAYLMWSRDIRLRVSRSSVKIRSSAPIHIHVFILLRVG